MIQPPGLRGLVLACTLLPLVAGGGTEPVAGQSVDTEQTATVPHTPWGDPDLQGVWDFATNTPLERPDEYAGREWLTEEEVAATNRQWSTFATSERRRELTPEFDLSLNFNQFWWDMGPSTGRTSLIVDPPDGRFPSLVPEREAYEATPEVHRLQNIRFGLEPAAGPEELQLNDRCIVDRDVPILSSSDNNHVQIVQSPGYVVILLEKIHDARIVPVWDRTGLTDTVRQWLGVSRGHWEGDTLVVETKNFHSDADFFGSGPDRHVVERLRRHGEDAIEYSFTVSDPTVWPRPWTAMTPWRAAGDGTIFEYACHEGNYSMANMLSAARAREEDRP